MTMNRRHFVSSLAAASAVVASQPRLFAADAAARPRVGLIGCGWYGGVNLEAFMKHVGVEVVSLCEVNRKFLAKTLALVARYQQAVPKTFVDFRELLASGKHDIVLVGTPDHWHALPAIAAMQAGADVYLEKPVGVDVIEGEALVAAARKHGRVVQVNTQRRSNPLYAEVRDKYLRSGRLGKIGLVEMYSYLGSEGWQPGPLPDAPVPEHLDYEWWAGPAPKVPYKDVIEDRGWRAFMEFGTGPIGNLGVHMIDKVRWMLGLGWPERVSSSGGIYVHKESFSNLPDTQRSVLHYPDLDLSWEHRMWGASPIPARHWTDQWGARIIGQHGTVTLTSLEYVFVSKDGKTREGVNQCSKTGDLENADFARAGEVFGDVERRHVLDFMQARASRGRPVADIEEGHISSACCELALIAQELKRPVAYDPKTRTVPGDAEATKLLARSYRAPWVHPDPEKV